MNIYKHELRYNMASTVLWIIVLCGLVSILMCFFPVIKNDIDNFLKLLDNFPPAMKAVIGVAVDSFSSPLGYYCFSITYASLFAAIQAMNLGVGIVSKEERDRTCDFLMTKPVSRTKILTAKLLASLTIFIVTNIICSAVTAAVIAGLSGGDYDGGKFALINASLLLLQITFFSIGIIVSVAAKKIRSVLPVSLGLVFAFFAISAFAVTSQSNKLRFLTPFQYYKAENIFSTGKYESEYVIASIVVVVVSITFSYILYKRKNIHAV